MGEIDNDHLHLDGLKDKVSKFLNNDYVSLP